MEWCCEGVDGLSLVKIQWLSSCHAAPKSGAACIFHLVFHWILRLCAVVSR